MRNSTLQNLHSTPGLQTPTVGLSTCAVFLHCSGDTFTDGDVKYAMTSIRVPEPVMSLALTPKDASQFGSFVKALARFQKEDPTFKVCVSVRRHSPARSWYRLRLCLPHGQRLMHSQTLHYAAIGAHFSSQVKYRFPSPGLPCRHTAVTLIAGDTSLLSACTCGVPMLTATSYQLVLRHVSRQRKDRRLSLKGSAQAVVSQLPSTLLTAT